ncbi:MAG: hypothetical protein CVU39_26075 [Chloroflexi bacterium HGW-Chloroflexi-10]|nr:MAG: hypothetical protein CVU39_26075 [Chloroflexi bacterium HGW-Chloroflexi-10]
MSEKINFYDTIVYCRICGYRLIRREAFIGFNLSVRLNNFLCFDCAQMAKTRKTHWFNSYQRQKMRNAKKNQISPVDPENFSYKIMNFLKKLLPGL